MGWLGRLIARKVSPFFFAVSRGELVSLGEVLGWEEGG